MNSESMGPRVHGSTGSMGSTGPRVHGPGRNYAVHESTGPPINQIRPNTQDYQLETLYRTLTAQAVRGIFIYIYIYTHTHTHTHTYMYIHTLKHTLTAIQK